MRLEQSVTDITDVVSTNFNSIKVRLELTALSVLKILSPNFNSIKVRLELVVTSMTTSPIEISIP